MKKIMKQNASLLFVLAMAMLVLGFGVGANCKTASASHKVNYIGSEYKTKNNKTKKVYVAKTSATGKTVWKFNKAPYEQMTQYDSSQAYMKGSKVYIWVNSKLYVLKRDTGKIIWKKNVHRSGNGGIEVDSKGNIYGVGVEGSMPSKFTKNGKLVWTAKMVPQKYQGGGAYDIKVTKKTVKVYWEYSDYQYLVFDKKTGRFLKAGPKTEW